MIVEIDKMNLSLLDNSFIDVDYIKRELISNPYGKVIILKELDEIIGYIYYSDIYERIEINMFEINLIHRNCGKGDFLLKKLIQKVNKNITLEVRKDNIYAIKLYEKNGFKQVAIRKNYYNGIDGILMERKVNNK